MNRRELFTSFGASLQGEVPKKEVSFLRPPYYGDESLFHNECSKCDAKCATVCEEDIIKIAQDKTPYLDFSKSGCTFCDDCAIACEEGVLSIENKRELNAKVTINQNECLSWQAVMCFSCKDPCLDKAIDFQAMFMPTINDNCTSCGFCISRCPATSIDIKVL